MKSISYLRAECAAIHGAFPKPENCAIYSYIAASRRSPTGFVIRFRFPHSYFNYCKKLASNCHAFAKITRRESPAHGKFFELSIPVAADEARQEWLKYFEMI